VTISILVLWVTTPHNVNILDEPAAYILKAADMRWDVDELYRKSRGIRLRGTRRLVICSLKTLLVVN
jgi:hypothetical protein